MVYKFKTPTPNCFGVCQAAGALYKAIYCVRVVYREQERERLKTESLKHNFEAIERK